MNFHIVVLAGGYVAWRGTPSCSFAWFDPGQPYQPLSLTQLRASSLAARVATVTEKAG